MAETPFRLRSDAFEEGQFLPGACTCDGDDRSPPLDWDGIPDGTRSLVLTVTDPDAPGGTSTHWLLYDLSPDTGALPEGAGRGGLEGRNDFQVIGWSGPCPPPRHGDHRYVFTLFALDCDSLGLPEGASRKEVERAMEGRILDSAELMGRYRR